MKARVVVRRAAELDLEAIEDWYESETPGLGNDFRNAFQEVAVRIGKRPLAYPEMYRDFRRALLPRFPYAVWYRLVEDAAVVLACVHGSRDPGVARGRLDVS